jgi:hypothetical protein
MTVRPIFLPLLALCLVIAAADAQEADLFDRLEKLLADPPATGILVTQVLPDSQAMAAGMRLGDVVFSYGGWPVADLQTLGAAKEALGEAETIEMVVVRDGKRISFSLSPGQIGFMGVGVEKGVAAPALPADTGVKFDFSALRSGASDRWYLFTLDGETKAGFEHGVLRLRGDTLILRREVAFDGGEQWGLNHFDVIVVARTRPRLRTIATRFKNPLTGWIGTGRLVRAKGEGPRWRAKFPGAEPRMEPAPKRYLPTYLIESLAPFMPRVRGACYRFVPLNEGFGQPGLPSALVCEGRQEVMLPAGAAGVTPARKALAWKYVWLQIGGAVGGTYWVDDSGRTVFSDYGGARAYLGTRGPALANLAEGIVPQSAE